MKNYIFTFLLLCLFSAQVSNLPMINIQSMQWAAEQPNYELSNLKIKLPNNWRMAKSGDFAYYFIDEKDEYRGSIYKKEYTKNFDFQQVMPNHSSIVNIESLNIPLGKGQLITLDADNGTPASGDTGTHYDYYAVANRDEKVIYVINLSLKDKNPETKNKFIEILTNIKVGKE